MEPVSLAVGGALLVVGFLVGRVVHRNGQPKARCGCSHHLSLHDPQAGTCQGTVKQEQESPGVTSC